MCDDSLPGAYLAIETTRLRLVWMSPSFMKASLEGRDAEAAAILGASLPHNWPDSETRRRLETRLAQMDEEPDTAEWLLRAIVNEEQRVVGIINFHGRPDELGRAELGYRIFPQFRRHGYASEAAMGMMSWANQHHGIETFVVSVSPGNEPSLRMAAKLGFMRVGSQIDPVDGEEWVFEFTWPSSHPTRR